MSFAALLAEYGTLIERQSGDHLFRQGDEDSALYQVRGGLLKAYYLSDVGREHIKSFLLPGATIGSLHGLMGGDGCSFSLICLEDSQLVRIGFQTVQDASREDPALAADLIDFLLGFAMKKEMREFELLCLSAEARYRRLLEQSPELVERVTQIDIARFLGVTPEGLSRIKRRVSVKG